MATWLITLVFTFILLALMWGIIYITGGTKYAYVHLMYIPVMFAGYILGPIGGIFIAIVAGILVGPLMPMDVETNIPQPFDTQLTRTLFFILIGGIIGFASNSLKKHLIKIHDTLAEISYVYGNTLKTYARMISARDEQTSSHCERVAYNAVLLGKAYGLTGPDLDALYWSGLLHDVGKIGVKEKILLKEGKLTPEEFEQVKKHSEIGYELIKSLSPQLLPVAEGIHSHHEKWNGSGYPKGLKGKNIPLFGRILAIVDVFEALTSERPYKEPWRAEEAIQYLLENKGVLFDPELTTLFEQLYNDGKVWIYQKSIQLDHSLIPTSFNKEILKRT